MTAPRIFMIEDLADGDGHEDRIKPLDDTQLFER